MPGDVKERLVNIVAGFISKTVIELPVDVVEALRKLMFDIVVRALAYGYQKYVEALKEKIKAGMERARKEGKHVGRPPSIPEEFVVKLIRKHPYLSKKDLWRMAKAENYRISYPRFVKKVNEAARKYGLKLGKNNLKTS